MVKNNNRGSSTHGPVGVGDKVQSSLPKSMQCRKRQYKGVRMRSWGSWVSEIRAPNQKTRIWLGSYSTAEAAARAYDAALLCLKGSSANLNFPTSPSSALLPDTLLSPKSIQRVAAAAANATTTTPSSSSSPSPSSSSSSSSAGHQDEIFVPSLMSYDQRGADDLPRQIDPWIDFGELHSPKYPDQMIGGCAIFAPPPPLEWDDEGDIRLWSF
ncbi:ethylene-responsive transcription factor ERF014 [Magnolia sinica]|uniref:ethylene-responsive transcription factor ERF014 n=1 Tax=Magnolia sinica TaxID=86752 RepID=UPI00265A91A9|nr:ethylene-responsive transcription factor ERF014 [Magnolia sinica]